MATTMYNLTDGQIRKLQHEAEVANDHAQVRECRIACGDDEMATQGEVKAARERCLDAINDAEAQAGDES